MIVDSENLQFSSRAWDKDKAGSTYGQFQWRIGSLTPALAAGSGE
jgi:hypothetical protein